MLLKLLKRSLSHDQRTAIVNACPDSLFAWITNHRNNGVTIERSGFYWVISSDGITLRSPTPKMTGFGLNYFKHKFLKYFTIEKDDTCLDIGACIGDTTLAMVKLGCGKVCAVEPDPINAMYLRYNVGHLADVYEIAISDKRGQATLHVARSIAGHSLADYRTRRYDSIEVDCVTLNQLSCVTNLWDFVKIDVQGSEETVFRGQEKFLSQVKKMVVETHKWREGDTAPSLYQFLEPHFKNVRFDNRLFYCWND